MGIGLLDMYGEEEQILPANLGDYELKYQQEPVGH